VHKGQSLEEAIRAKAAELGFVACGFAPADAADDAGIDLRGWIEAGHHGTMGWIEERAHHRVSAQALWPEAKSAIALGMSYAPASDPLALGERPELGRISVYAQGRDYHEVMKSKLKALGRFIWDTYQHDLKVFVDTAPLMEKPSAQAAGHGWQGKHTNLVSRQFGSWLFLGEILLSVELPADSPETDHCGQCHACLDICPTNAFPAPYRLEARRCISYLTIEHEGPIDRALRPLLGNRIYGCDDCLAVCPWNKFAKEARETALMPRPALDAPLLAELATLDDEGFRKRFAGTAVKRIGRDRFLRNVAYALGNSAARETALPAVERLLKDPSSLVRGAAVWALSRLSPDQVARSQPMADETDAEVCAEWNAARNIEEQGTGP